MFRFSLSGLFLLISFSALGCASLICATDIWRQLIVTLALVCVVTATVMAIVGREHRQPFALGFALVGWVYLILTFIPILDVKNHLLTTRALMWLGKGATGGSDFANWNPYPSIVADFDFDGKLDIYVTNGMTGGNGLYRLVSSGPIHRENFLVIGHGLWTIGLAVLGGLLASFLNQRQEHQSSHHAPS